MVQKIWLDDIRKAPENWHWVKSFKQAKEYVEQEVHEHDNLVISFDHDLGGKKTGYDFAAWLVANSYTGEYRVHSANPVGKNNICQLLNRYGWDYYYGWDFI